jgi:GH18 family chitinase
LTNTILFRYLEDNSFDGLDIDWQYPNGANGAPQDKQNFILLLKVYNCFVFFVEFY